MTNSRPSGVMHAPRFRRDRDGEGFALALERLQCATDPGAVFAIVEAALSACPGVGRGAVYTVAGRGSLVRHATIDGPRAADLSIGEIELFGVARRALREAQTVRQAGLAPDTVWACPLRSADGIEAVVAIVGEPAVADDLV
ncbi:hypothetical protein K8I85_10430, partial [bacterium]|nr:hypothetical protein [bacterium]